MTRVVVDRDSVNDDFVVVKKLYRRSGELVSKADPILEIESSKTLKEIVSPEDGVLQIALNEGDEIALGALLFEVQEGATTEGESTPRNIPTTPVNDANPTVLYVESQGRELSRPAAELAAQLAVDKNMLPGGWVTTADVRAAIGRIVSPTGSRIPNAPKSDDIEDRTLPAPPKARFRRERMSLRKRTEARNLSRANGNGATSMIGVEISLPAPRLVAPPFIFQESITDLVVFEAARLVRRFPELNAFHVDERTVGYFEEVNVGISFDSGRNLKVLALANADTLSLPMVQSGIEQLLHAYESGTPIDESLLSTSTMTISDLSRAPADFMLPLLNVDQSLIIGITRRDLAEYSLYATFDHRVSEGLQVAQMLGELRERIVSHHRPTPVGGRDSSSLRCSVCDQSTKVEVSRGGRGLIRVVLADGSDGQLCWSCFSGW
jgi:2-oxoglutarate dehydrogenase E2 component (dihydrolipoamide succinyltransferase)